MVFSWLPFKPTPKRVPSNNEPRHLGVCGWARLSHPNTTVGGRGTGRAFSRPPPAPSLASIENSQPDFKTTAPGFWLAGWLVCGWVGWVGWWVVWLVGWLAGWLVGWLAGWLVGWLAGWLVGWLAGWLVGWVLAWLGLGWLASCFSQFTSEAKPAPKPCCRAGAKGRGFSGAHRSWLFLLVPLSFQRRSTCHPDPPLPRKISRTGFA